MSFNNDGSSLIYPNPILNIDLQFFNDLKVDSSALTVGTIKPFTCVLNAMSAGVNS